jgi:hypothetical protein
MPLGKNIVTASALRNASIHYQMPNFIAQEVFPVMQVNDPTMKLVKYLPSDYFRDEAEVRGEGGAAKRGGWKTTELTYNCQEYAFATEVTDELRRNSKKQSGQPLQPDIEAIEFLKQKIYTKREKDVVALIKASTWADTNAGGEDAAGLWASSATANTFKADITNGLQVLRGKGVLGMGVETRLILDDLTFDQVVEIAAIKDQIKYTSAESITPEILARILKIDRVIVATAVESTDEETKAGTAFTAQRIWHSNTTKGIAMLCAYPKRLGLRSMTAGLIVNDKFDENEGGQYERIMKWRDNDHHLDVYELAENRDELQICADAAYLWKDTIVT